jgi:hypothetical protein
MFVRCGVMKPDKVPLELTDKCHCYEKDGRGVVAGFWHKMEVKKIF